MERKRINIFILFLILIVFLGAMGFLFAEKPLTNSIKDLTQRTEETRFTKIHHHKQYMSTFRELPSLHIQQHPPSENVKQLQETIDKALDHDNLEGAIIGISVRDENDEIIYQHQGNVRLIPASNMKIITAIAALEILGSDYQFTTDIQVDGEIKNGILEGDLYIVGKGDPTLQMDDFTMLAKQVKEAGITEITGSIYADDTWYDDERYSQDLSWINEYDYYGNATSALTVATKSHNDLLLGSIILEIIPGEEVGEKPKIDITPETDYVKSINKGDTVEAGKPLTLPDKGKHGSNEITIEGNIPLDSITYERRRAVWEPTEYALHSFSQSLEKQDILFSNERLSVKEVPKEAETIFTKKSAPLKEIIMPFMKQSNNGIGEVLVKEIGKVEAGEGSWREGLPVVRRVLADLGLDTTGINIRDGSGMSDRNLVSANFFTKLLYNIQDKAWFPDFKDSLPKSGELDHALSGTLHGRFLDEDMKGKVLAKTGNLHKVSTLSGYVTTDDGTKLNFSILINNYIKEPVFQIQDEIVTILAETNLTEE